MLGKINFIQMLYIIQPEHTYLSLAEELDPELMLTKQLLYHLTSKAILPNHHTLLMQLPHQNFD